MSHPFLDTIAARPILGDGAMGTVLYARGANPDAGFENLNLTNKDLVQQVHIDYINAGAELIETNSYCGNRFRQATYGMEKEVWQLNVWAAKVARNAREIAGRPVFIAGSVGPTGKLLAPIGDVTKQELFDAFREQMEALLAGGVDLFMIETMTSLVELTTAIKAARQVAKLPIVAQLSFTTEGTTFFGTSPEEAANTLLELQELRPDVIGINCGTGPGPALETLKVLSHALHTNKNAAAHTYLSCLPNAGLPGRVGNNFLYISRPDYCASFVESYIEAGARIIGGCCGTTPEHIKAMRQSLDKYLKAHQSKTTTGELTKISATTKPAAVAAPEAAPAQQPSDGLALQLKTNDRSKFFISVELDPPKGPVPQKLLAAAEQLKAAGADTINVGDSPMAKVRMSSLATCLLIQQKVGIDTIIHFTTRDRNLMGIQADLLGCQSLGIKNILALTGDPPSIGNYAHATAVYDVDSIGLIQIISQLNQGLDIGGNSIGSRTNLSIGCALNPTFEDRKLEIQRVKKKLAAGAHFIMTQPLYQLSDLTDFMQDFGPTNVPILAGIMPLNSFKHAEYLHNEVPGISIPEHIRNAMEKAGDEGARVGLELSTALIEELRPYIAGIYLVPSFGRYDEMCHLIKTLKSAI